MNDVQSHVRNCLVPLKISIIFWQKLTLLSMLHSQDSEINLEKVDKYCKSKKTRSYLN